VIKLISTHENKKKKMSYCFRSFTINDLNENKMNNAYEIRITT